VIDFDVSQLGNHYQGHSATGHHIPDDSDWQVLYGTLIVTPSASWKWVSGRSGALRVDGSLT
jgi:hypothetical protein